MGSGLGLGRLLGSAEHPGEADHGDGETDHARDLRDAEVAEPEAVEAERFDGKSADGIEADVAEEQRAGIPPEPRAEQQDEDQEDSEVPERLIEEGGGGSTRTANAGGLVPPELLASCAQELSRFPLHERIVLPITAMVMDELRGEHALAEFERRVAQRPAALATAWLSLLMRVKSLGLVDPAALSRVEEQLLRGIRTAVAAGKVKVPAWAKTVITRSEGPSFDPRALEGLVDYEIVRTTRDRAMLSPSRTSSVRRCGP